MEHYINLVAEANRHAYLYYVEDNPEISDFDYDRMFNEIAGIEKDFPDIILPESPTQRVGDKLSGKLATFNHETKMLSLDNTYTPDETIEFFAKKADITDPSLELVGEPKMDGLAISLHYEFNKLVRAVTRGDGSIGEDVTHTVKTIRSIPLVLNSEVIYPKLEIRGEAFMPIKSFEEVNEKAKKINEEAGSNKEKIFKNPRNAAAGSIKNLDPKIASNRNLDFIAYSVLGADDLFNSHSDSLEFVASLGIKINKHMRVIKPITSESIEEYYDYLTEIRDELGYEIDGIVFKFNSYDLQDELGFTGRIPRWAVSRKFPEVGFQTPVTDFVDQVGRTGMITPVVHFEPQMYSGSEITKATLHNYGKIQDKFEGIAIGDVIEVIKGGAVIPHVTRVIKRSGNPSIQPPTECPTCGSALSKVDSAYYCDNTASCPDQATFTICHFASKKKMNINGLAEGIVVQLHKAGVISSYADLFYLNEDQLTPLDKMGEKKAQNLLSAIEASKKTTLPRFIAALGIREVNDSTAEELANHFKTFEAFENATAEELMSITNIGEVVSGNVIRFMSNPVSKQNIRRIFEAGLIIEEIKKSDLPQVLEGQVWVVTGSLSNYDKSSIKEELKAMGAKVTGSVSKKTDVLLFGEKAGSKLANAQKLQSEGHHIKILSEDEYIAQYK